MIYHIYSEYIMCKIILFVALLKNSKHYNKAQI